MSQAAEACIEKSSFMELTEKKEESSTSMKKLLQDRPFGNDIEDFEFIPSQLEQGGMIFSLSKAGGKN